MNGFLWLGVVCTAVLVVSVAFDALDGLDDAFDAIDVGPPWLSAAVVLAFLGAFGFGTGAFVDALGPAAALPGAAAGVGFGWLAARLTRLAVDLPTGTTDTEEAMLGSLGRITTPPTPTRTGEALLDRPAGPTKVACTADAELPIGTEVVVVDVRSATLVHVEPFDPSFPPDPPAVPPPDPPPLSPPQEEPPR